MGCFLSRKNPWMLGCIFGDWDWHGWDEVLALGGVLTYLDGDTIWMGIGI